MVGDSARRTGHSSPVNQAGKFMKSRNRLLSFLLLALVAVAAASPGPAEAQARGPARDTPYSTSFVINLTSGSGTNAYSPDIVPSNKRLVIEFASVTVVAQPGDKPSLSLNDVVNGAAHAYWIPLTLVETASSGLEVYRATQLVKLNHEGNGLGGPSAQCSRAVNSFVPLSCQVTLSGYLVDK